jgi:hypothetical protein
MITYQESGERRTDPVALQLFHAIGAETGDWFELSPTASESYRQSWKDAKSRPFSGADTD